TVSADTRMFPCAAYPGPVRPPAHSMQPSPVKVAPPPWASTTPSWRCARPSSGAVSRSTASFAERPWRSTARPSRPQRGLAWDCVAIAPACGSAPGPIEPTARNLDWTATPHWPASRSHATIEYVLGLAVGQLPEIELEQLLAVRRNEDAGDLRSPESGPY